MQVDGTYKNFLITIYVRNNMLCLHNEKTITSDYACKNGFIVENRTKEQRFYDITGEFLHEFAKKVVEFFWGKESFFSVINIKELSYLLNFEYIDYIDNFDSKDYLNTFIFNYDEEKNVFYYDYII